MGKVIHKRNAPDGWEDNPNYVFIGRPSKWGNPFAIGKDGGRQMVIDKYCEWILQRPELIAQAKRELVDKTLVCYCKPLDCHGDVLLKLIES